MYYYATDAPEKIWVPWFIAIVATIPGVGINRWLTTMTITANADPNPELGLLFVVLGAASGIIINAVLYVCFDRWWWRWFSWSVPDLEGTWVGEVYRRNTDTGGEEKRDAVMRIRQTWSKISVEMETCKSTSELIMAAFNTQGALPKLSYQYEVRPKSVPNAGNMHTGVARHTVTFEEPPAKSKNRKVVRSIDAEYYTDQYGRTTAGQQIGRINL